MGSLVGLTVWRKDYGNSTDAYEMDVACSSNPDRMVAYFSMVHVGIWIIVGIFDRYNIIANTAYLTADFQLGVVCFCYYYRIVQWRHQTLRRKGYLKFYRRMRNVRRVPFIIVSISNAALLFYVSFLYFKDIQQNQSFHKMHPVVLLYVIIGCEMIITVPCLVYYIGL